MKGAKKDLSIPPVLLDPRHLFQVRDGSGDLALAAIVAIIHFQFDASATFWQTETVYASRCEKTRTKKNAPERHILNSCSHFQKGYFKGL